MAQDRTSVAADLTRWGDSRTVDQYLADLDAQTDRVVARHVASDRARHALYLSTYSDKI